MLRCIQCFVYVFVEKEVNQAIVKVRTYESDVDETLTSVHEASTEGWVLEPIYFIG